MNPISLIMGSAAVVCIWVGTVGTTRAKYQTMYWYRRAVKAAGYCPFCYRRLNHTSKGRGICNNIDCKK